MFVIFLLFIFLLKIEEIKLLMLDVNGSIFLIDFLSLSYPIWKVIRRPQCYFFAPPFSSNSKKIFECLILIDIHFSTFFTLVFFKNEYKIMGLPPPPSPAISTTDAFICTLALGRYWSRATPFIILQLLDDMSSSQSSSASSIEKRTGENAAGKGLQV